MNAQSAGSRPASHLAQEESCVDYSRPDLCDDQERISSVSKDSTRVALLHLQEKQRALQRREMELERRAKEQEEKYLQKKSNLLQLSRRHRDARKHIQAASDEDVIAGYQAVKHSSRSPDKQQPHVSMKPIRMDLATIQSQQQLNTSAFPKTNPTRHQQIVTGGDTPSKGYSSPCLPPETTSARLAELSEEFLRNQLHNIKTCSMYQPYRLGHILPSYQTELATSTSLSSSSDEHDTQFNREAAYLIDTHTHGPSRFAPPNVPEPAPPPLSLEAQRMKPCSLSSGARVVSDTQERLFSIGACGNSTQCSQMSTCDVLSEMLFLESDVRIIRGSYSKCFCETLERDYDMSNRNKVRNIGLYFASVCVRSCRRPINYLWNTVTIAGIRDFNMVQLHHDSHQHNSASRSRCRESEFHVGKFSRQNDCDESSSSRSSTGRCCAREICRREQTPFFIHEQGRVMQIIKTSMRRSLFETKNKRFKILGYCTVICFGNNLPTLKIVKVTKANNASPLLIDIYASEMSQPSLFNVILGVSKRDHGRKYIGSLNGKQHQLVRHSSTYAAVFFKNLLQTEMPTTLLLMRYYSQGDRDGFHRPFSGRNGNFDYLEDQIDFPHERGLTHRRTTNSDQQQLLLLQQQQQAHRSSQQLQRDLAVAGPAAAIPPNRRQSPARALQFRKSAYESRRQSKAGSVGMHIDSFQLLIIIGRGHFGNVILVQYRNTCKYFVINSFKKGNTFSRNVVESLLSYKCSFEVINTMQHPFLVNLCFPTEQHVCFVMEYATKGKLMMHTDAEPRQGCKMVLSTPTQTCPPARHLLLVLICKHLLFNCK